MSKTNTKIIATIIVIILAFLVLLWEITILSIPPVIPVEYNFIGLDDCETLTNISEPYQENYTILLDSIACEGDYAITYTTTEDLPEVEIVFNLTFLSNYSFIGFTFYISNATNLELLNQSEPVVLLVWNQTKENGSDFAWEFDELEVGCNNLTASHDELNITNTFISNLFFVIKSGDHVQAGAYAIDNIYILVEA